MFTSHTQCCFPTLISVSQSSRLQGRSCSSLRTLYRRVGVMMRPARAGTTAALNQVSHGELMGCPSSAASLMHSRFWAAPVKNMPEECTLPWNWDCTRNLPSLPADASPAHIPQGSSPPYLGLFHDMRMSWIGSNVTGAILIACKGSSAEIVPFKLS